MRAKGPDGLARPGGTSGLPIVAVVGRPNVGKSTLFNRLIGQRLAIVLDEPGVTRDRQYADTTAFGRPYTLVDTGGFDPEDDDPMRSGIARHVEAAIAEADVVLFITDGSLPLVPADRAAVQLLRRSDKPVLYAANKVDSQHEAGDSLELYRLGVDHVYPISALHGRGLGELETALVAAMPKPEPVVEEDETLPRIVIVGRPNAGKSSLLNRVSGQDRMLVSPVAGTTRDAIDTLVTRNDRSYVFVDTAGIRKKSKVTKADDDAESLSVMRAIRAIDRAHIVVLLTDGETGVADQDAKILSLAEDRGRAVIIALNKSDLLDRDETKRAETAAREQLRFASYAPLMHISAKTGKGVGHLFSVIDEVFESYTKRIGTGELNRFFSEVLETHPPPTVGSKAPRLYYVTQASVAPPTFVAMTNTPEAIHVSYQRYVVNQLRQRFGFHGTPVRVNYRARRRRDAPPNEQ